MYEVASKTAPAVDVKEVAVDSEEVESRRSLPNGFELWLQRIFGWIFLLPLHAIIIGLMRLRSGFQISDRKGLRKQFLEITKSKDPLIICGNHLTLIDSIVLLWALASPFRYLINYRIFAWNLPAAENSKKRWTWRIITYLNKCIPVIRSGDAQHAKSIIEITQGILQRGEVLMLFPEGTRSRTGRVSIESATYGVGKILQGVSRCRVLCIYLRGRGQDSYSDFPKKGEIFDIRTELLDFMNCAPGLRGARESSLKIIHKLKEMEDNYFNERSCANDRQ